MPVPWASERLTGTAQNGWTFRSSATLAYVAGDSNDPSSSSARSSSDNDSDDHPVIYAFDSSVKRILLDPTGTAQPTSQIWHVVADDTQEMNRWVPDREGHILLGMAFDGDNTAG